MANNGVCGVGVAYNARIGGGCGPWPPCLQDHPFWWDSSVFTSIQPVSLTFLPCILLTTWLFYRGFLATQRGFPEGSADKESAC